jgi:hypothetical protein
MVAFAASPARVGFTYKLRDYTADNPCLFRDHCTPGDAANWARHAQEWITELRRHAQSPEQLQQLRDLVRRYGVFAESAATTRFDPRSEVEGFVSVARLAKMLIDSWGVQANVDNDWGFVGPLQTPVPSDLAEWKATLPSIEEWWATIKRRAMSGRYLPAMLLAAVALYLLSERSKAW